MGSGCVQNTKSTSTCTSITPSNCVQYQGDAVPLLGICTGDTITEVEQAIIAKLQSLLDGTGLTLSQVTLDNCDYLKALFGSKDKTAVNLIQLLVDALCDQNSVINTLLGRTAPSNFVYDLRCLPTITSPTTEKILQSLIISHCDLSDQVDSIITDSGNTTIIDSRVNTVISGLISSNGNTGITKTVDASTGTPHYNFTHLVPPFGAVMYVGPLTNFDADGTGKVGTAYENWQILNGKKGTIDMRGFVPVGAIQGVPGGALDPIVDPAVNADASMNYAFGSKGGLGKVTISKANIPVYDMISTSVDITSTNSIPLYTKYCRLQGSDSRMYAIGNDLSGLGTNSFTLYSKSVSGTVTTSSGGSGVAMENRMPYKAVNWIVKV